MANLNGFDATQVDPRGTFEAIPAGWYLVAIVESESKPTKSGTGTYLSLTLEIIEGENKGRKLWDRLNLDNPNAQAVEISKATLSAICHAVGVLRPTASEELHNKPMLAKISVREYQGEYQNEVKGYKAQAQSGNNSGLEAKPNNGSAPGKKRWEPRRVQRNNAAQHHDEGAI
jgi:hypothetical protein